MHLSHGAMPLATVSPASGASFTRGRNPTTAQQRKISGAACINCSRQRKRCSTLRPCERCTLLGIACEPAPPSLRPRGRKRKDLGLDLLSSSAQHTLSVRVVSPGGPPGQALGLGFGFEERVCLSVFLQFTNTMLPLAPISLLREGLCVQVPNLRTAHDHAVLALLLGSMAMGAALQRSPSAMTYLGSAKERLADCYDVPSYETLCALCAVAAASFHVDRRGVFLKYARYASVVYRELVTTQALDALATYNATIAVEYLRGLAIDEARYVKDALLSDLQDFIEETEGMKKLGTVDVTVEVVCFCAISFGGYPQGHPKPPKQLALEEMGSISAESKEMLHLANTRTANAHEDAAITLLNRADQLRATGLLYGMPMAEFVLACAPFVVQASLRSNSIAEQAAEKAARTIIELLERYPVLLTAFRKGTVMQEMLNVLEIVAHEDAELRRRTQRLRTFTPHYSTDMVPDLEGDAEEEDVLNFKAMLVESWAKRSSHVEEHGQLGNTADPMLGDWQEGSQMLAEDVEMATVEARHEYLEDMFFVEELNELQRLLEDEL